jgi:glycosyltransferase involved in cell wall biosynthesis
MTTQSKDRLRVLSLISSEGYFGVENMLVNLCVALEKHGCASVIGVFRDPLNPHTEIADRARERGLQVEMVPCGGRFDPCAIRQIRKLIRKHHANVIHSHGYKADIYGYTASAFLSVGRIATCHNWLGHSWSMRCYAALDRIILRNFDRVVVVSNPVAQILRRWHVPAKMVSTISNGVEIESFRNAPPTFKGECSANDAPIVGFVGRLVPEKGGAELLRAAQLVLRTLPTTKFAIIGNGSARSEWESLAHDLGIHDRVMFTGVRTDMPGIYASLRMLVLPSLREAMPMCVLEAMAAGTPVIATRVGAVPRLVDHNRTGVLVQPGDVNALAAAITRLLSHPHWSQQLGENGRARVEEHFSADAMARDYLEAYREVLDKRQMSGRKAALIPTV